MKTIFLLSLFLVIMNCSKPKTVLICGDHICVNKQEAQQYFKSICTYITRKEYNQKFFINNNFDSNAKSVWKNKDIWEQWLEVR